jgi:hypothetical protein
MNYKSVYSCWLYDEVKSGKKVYALDRKFKKVSLVNDLTIDQLVAVINSDEAEPSRYEFWYEEEVKVTEEKENA